MIPRTVRDQAGNSISSHSILCLYMFMRIFDNRWGCVLLSSSTSMLDLLIMFVMVVWLQKRTLKLENWTVKKSFHFLEVGTLDHEVGTLGP